MANLKDLIVNGVANFIGRVYAQTPTTGTSDRQVATTEFVQENLKTKVTNCILEAPNGVMVLASDNINFTLKQGLKVLIPNGRNADGTLKNTEITLASDVTYTNLTSSSTNMLYYAFVDTSGIAHATSIYQSGFDADKNDSIVSAQATLYYAIDTNKTYLRTESATSWTEVSWAFVGKLIKTSASSTVQPEQPICLLKQSDLNRVVKIKKVYRQQKSGYIIWSNGYCEQWGVSDSNASLITLVKTYASIYYFPFVSSASASTDHNFDKGGVAAYVKTANTFQVMFNRHNVNPQPFYWKTIGYLADDQY